VLPQAPVPDGQEGPFCRTFSETTNVLFHELSTELIDAYIHTGGQQPVICEAGVHCY
jgi:predicted house-cleaning NTP pyrophosphatase (Maf/HAM1 superfamily)